jgi:hypothetical protein
LCIGCTFAVVSLAAILIVLYNSRKRYAFTLPNYIEDEINDLTFLADNPTVNNDNNVGFGVGEGTFGFGRFGSSFMA